jgi:hypothetical protein
MTTSFYSASAIMHPIDVRHRAALLALQFGFNRVQLATSGLERHTRPVVVTALGVNSVATYASGADPPGSDSAATAVASVLAVCARLEPARPGAAPCAVQADK